MVSVLWVVMTIVGGNKCDVVSGMCFLALLDP